MLESVRFRIEMLRKLWKFRGRYLDQEYYLSSWMVVVYQIKCAICLLIPVSFAPSKFAFGDWIEVAVTGGGIMGSHETPTVYWGEWLIVGRGWRNWWWDLYSDSN